MYKKYRILGTYSYVRELKPLHASNVRAFLLIESMQDTNCCYINDLNFCVRIGQKPILMEDNVYFGMDENHDTTELGILHRIVVHDRNKYVALFRER